MIIRKIPVQFLLECLNDMERSGIEYVDVVGKQGRNTDTLGLIVREEYAVCEGRITVAFDGKNINELIV